MTTIFAGKYFPIPADADGREFVRTGDEVLVEIEASRVSLGGFEAMIEDGRLPEARVVAALYLARSFIESRGVSEYLRSGACRETSPATETTTRPLQARGTVCAGGGAGRTLPQIALV